MLRACLTHCVPLLQTSRRRVEGEGEGGGGKKGARRTEGEVGGGRKEERGSGKER